MQVIASPSFKVAVPPRLDGQPVPVIETNVYPVNPSSLIVCGVFEVTGTEVLFNTSPPSTFKPNTFGEARVPVPVTFLISVMLAGISVFVIVQFLLSFATSVTCPTALQSPLKVALYPDTPVSLTKYVASGRVFVTPDTTPVETKPSNTDSANVETA